ncbi:MAG: hypothetical protein V1816_25140 [Pseudomonadota bacterium]
MWRGRLPLGVPALLWVLGSGFFVSDVLAVSGSLSAAEFSAWAEQEIQTLDRLAERAFFLCELAVDWGKVDKERAAAVLEQALATALLAEDEQARVQARKMETEAAFLNPVDRKRTLDNCGLILEKTRPVWVVLAAAEAWNEIDPRRAEDVVRQALRLARKNTDAGCWDLEARAIAAQWARGDLEVALGLAGKINAPSTRAWAFLSIAKQLASSDPGAANKVFGLAWQAASRVVDPLSRVISEAKIGSSWSRLSPGFGNLVLEEALKTTMTIEAPPALAAALCALGVEWARVDVDKIFSLTSLVPQEFSEARLDMLLSAAVEAPPGDGKKRLTLAARQRVEETRPGYVRDRALSKLAALMAEWAPGEALELADDISDVNEAARSEVLSAAVFGLAEKDYGRAFKIAAGIRDDPVKIKTFIFLAGLEPAVEGARGAQALEAIKQEIENTASAETKVAAALAWSNHSPAQAWLLVDGLENPAARASGYGRLAVRFWRQGAKRDAELAWRLAVETVGADNLESGLSRAGLLKEIAGSMALTGSDQANAVFEVSRRVATGQ